MSLFDGCVLANAHEEMHANAMRMDLVIMIVPGFYGFSETAPCYFSLWMSSSFNSVKALADQLLCETKATAFT